MFGFSVYMNEDINSSTADYIKSMKKSGFSGIFTSMHIPEEHTSLYKKRLIQLGKLALINQLDLMVDISSDSLQKAGFDFNDMKALTEIGVTGLRIDDEISMKQIAIMSRKIQVSLNASTLTKKNISDIKQYHGDFNNIEAWHNYYPRPETGLGEALFVEKNKFLMSLGLRVFAFVPGDSALRGPVFAGLPTLERDRYKPSFSSALRMYSEFNLYGIYLGDNISDYTRFQFEQYLKKQVIPLRVNLLSVKHVDMVTGTHKNRHDAARDCIRSSDSRLKSRETINPEHLLPRVVGSVTIDNEKYGRYMGELQIIRVPLSANDKCNVVGHVIDEDLPLIDCIGPGQDFELTVRHGEKL
ncbi:MupG family TIM beta-alpha barrel fold protein [Leuconostoc pseudomesenteroides]|uniref:MupG family TIM beta-alpha barrel fold protein n=1 Tax=Leuconostoc pseudomesenteroides TaxID=33968 RepID=UPI00228611FC|nr:MupG family TIM beta-alpha barrel fold protein [Leuconostoc pseudomesenteroides]WAM38436.1 MupG family TIM beta-alpha barrel fold protein [Leuconostoc pseudomesenteroides]